MKKENHNDVEGSCSSFPCPPAQSESREDLSTKEPKRQQKIAESGMALMAEEKVQQEESRKKETRKSQSPSDSLKAANYSLPPTCESVTTNDSKMDEDENTCIIGIDETSASQSMKAMFRRIEVLERTIQMMSNGVMQQQPPPGWNEPIADSKLIHDGLSSNHSLGPKNKKDHCQQREAENDRSMPRVPASPVVSSTPLFPWDSPSPTPRRPVLLTSRQPINLPNMPLSPALDAAGTNAGKTHVSLIPIPTPPLTPEKEDIQSSFVYPNPAPALEYRSYTPDYEQELRKVRGRAALRFNASSTAAVNGGSKRRIRSHSFDVPNETLLRRKRLSSRNLVKDANDDDSHSLLDSKKQHQLRRRRNRTMTIPTPEVENNHTFKSLHAMERKVNGNKLPWKEHNHGDTKEAGRPPRHNNKNNNGGQQSKSRIDSVTSHGKKDTIVTSTIEPPSSSDLDGKEIKKKIVVRKNSIGSSTPGHPKVDDSETPKTLTEKQLGSSSSSKITSDQQQQSDQQHRQNSQTQSPSLDKAHIDTAQSRTAPSTTTKKVETSPKMSSSMLSYLKNDLLNIDSKHQDGSGTEDVDANMEEFLRVPWKLECLLFFGLAICVNTFLNVITILPLKFAWSCVCLLCTILRPRNGIGGCRFHRRHLYQILQVSVIIIVYRHILCPISIGKLYHWIRGQAMIKLYVLIAIVEVFDRLMCSLGQDAFDSLYWNTTRRPYHPRLVISTLVVLGYTIVHSLILFVHIATLNVAMNSADEALLTLLVSGNFAEIKSTVFKKYNKQNLFKITTSDICERFKLALFLSLVLLLNCFQGGMDGTMIYNYVYMCLVVLAAEMLSDWIKHSFITKFNFIQSTAYPDYALILSGDVTGIGHEGVNLDNTHAAVKRLGLAQIPLVCVMARFFREAMRYALASYDTTIIDAEKDDDNDGGGLLTKFRLLYKAGCWGKLSGIFLAFYLLLLTIKVLLGFVIEWVARRMLYGPPSLSETANESNDLKSDGSGNGVVGAHDGVEKAKQRRRQAV